MSKPIKQHLIDPEICIRCYTCEMTCPVGAILHDDNSVVVDAEKCNFCMDCIPVCPTGSIDEWRVVNMPISIEEQLELDELPVQEDFADQANEAETSIEALDEGVAELLADAHSGAGGKAKPPESASKPSINLYMPAKPATAIVRGNFRMTDVNSDSDVHHIILDLVQQPFPVLEGQSVGIIAPGVDAKGNAHNPRLYSVSSPRSGERLGYNNLSLTVKREPDGVCSNYLCDLEKGAEVQMAGPFGSTFLLPNDSHARILMICTGTGSAPFRAFTMQRQRVQNSGAGGMTLIFGARTPESLPYFGPLKKVPTDLLKRHLVFSRIEGLPKQYVQDVLRDNADDIAQILSDPDSYIYICGLRAMEDGVEDAMSGIAESMGQQWSSLRDAMREQGRYHVETY